MGCFRVELHTPTGHLLPSIEYDGHRCFLGEAGQEFLVAVTSYGGKWQSSNKWSCEVCPRILNAIPGTRPGLIKRDSGLSVMKSQLSTHHKGQPDDSLLLPVLQVSLLVDGQVGAPRDVALCILQ